MPIDSEARRNYALLDQPVTIPDGSIDNTDRPGLIGQYIAGFVTPDAIVDLPPTELVWVYDYTGVQTVALHELFALELDDRLQDSETLRFRIAADDPKAGFVLIDGMARYRRRLYRIKDRIPSHDGAKATIDVEADALWIDLADRVIPGQFLTNDKTPAEGLDLIILHRDYGWTVGTVDAPPFAWYGIDKSDATILELLREWAKNTGSELVFDSFDRTVSLTPSQGSSRDVGFRYAWNLRGITRRETPPEVTRLYAYGRNGLTISGLTPDGTEHIDDFSFYIAQGLTAAEAEADHLREQIWKDDAFISDGPLYDAAVARLTQLAQPVIAYEAKVVDLSATGLPVEVELGDTVPVYDGPLGISIRERVVRLVTKPLSPWDNEIELAYLQGRVDLTSSTSSTSNTEEWHLFTYESLADRTIDVNLAILADIGLQFSSGGAIHHLDAEGLASGTGTLEVTFYDETLDAAAGPVFEVPFADGDPIHLASTWSDDNNTGRHLFTVRVKVVSGTGTVAFTAGDVRYSILAQALGVTLPPDENSITYDFTGSVQTFDVPPDVTSVVIDVYGAQGGTVSENTGGLGGRVRARVPVIAGERLDVYVGGQASSQSGGFNGGGNGGRSGARGGGGASDIRRVGGAVTNRILIGAGGGGGASHTTGNAPSSGGNGGYPDGEPGNEWDVFGPSATGGRGATQTAGGVAGTGNPNIAATDGTFAQGGTGAQSAASNGGGGGGGGLYGGGGGGWAIGERFGDGGGGSSGVVDPGPLPDTRPGTPIELLVENGVRSGHGQIIISWDTPA